MEILRSLEITYTLLNRERPREKGNYLNLCNHLFCRVNKVPGLKVEAKLNDIKKGFPSSFIEHCALIHHNMVPNY